MLRKLTGIHYCGAATARSYLSLIFVVCLGMFCFAQQAHAAIATTGDVDFSTSRPSGIGPNVIVGDTGSGTLDITGGSVVSGRYGYLGCSRGSTGIASINGVGSTWTSQSDFYVGFYGTGTLNITNGGEVISKWGTIAFADEITCEVTVNGPGSKWTTIGQPEDPPPYGMEPWPDLRVGAAGDAILNIINGGTVSNYSAYIAGYSSFDHSGEVTVDGAGSTWSTTSYLHIGYEHRGTLDITNGGLVSSDYSFIGVDSRATGEVSVNGAGSMWAINGELRVGHGGSGTLNITNGGLVSIGGDLTIDYYGHSDNDFINMSTGGMLALFGEADDSLDDFLAMIEGTDAIRYWDDDISDWADITGATYGDDYTLSYLTEGDLAGYTVLTVTAVPEPATMSLLALGGLAFLRRRRQA